MPYFAYILECADRTLYTGITTDVRRRFLEHQKGMGGHYTHAHGAKKILYTEQLPSRGAALRREAEIKKMGRAEKLKLIHKK